MKNQIGRGVKVNIFGVFENFCSTNKKENIFGFLCSLKTDFKKFSGTVFGFI